MFYDSTMSVSVATKLRSLPKHSEENTTRLIQRIQRGFPFSALAQFSKTSGLPVTAISDFLQIPPRTLARRRAEGKLRPDESERLLRLSTIFDKTAALFEGDVSAARRWLTRPVRGLGYEQPLVYARTEVGARQVERLIGQLRDGVFP